MLCNYCKIEKPLSAFPPSKKNYCSECLTKKVNEWRKKNKEKYVLYRRLYEKKYRRTKKYQEYQREYLAKWHKKNKTTYYSYEAHLKWKQEHPEGIKAQKLLRKAVRQGKIIPSILCQKCKKEKPLQAHHDDYLKPYNVKWLCGSCHRIQHSPYSYSL